MKLLPWCQEQPWWPIILPLLESGMVVMLHVPNQPPGLRLRYKVTGGTLILQQCSMPWYHIHTAWPMEAQVEFESLLESLGVTHDGPPRMGHA